MTLCDRASEKENLLVLDWMALFFRALHQMYMYIPLLLDLLHLLHRVLSVRFEVGGYLGTAPAGVILEAQENFSLENF